MVTEDTVRKMMLKMSPKTCDLDCMPTSLFFSILNLLDLSVAFDTIDHDFLLCRLKHVFGVTDVALVFQVSLFWVMNSSHLPCCMVYLRARSVLGPILFLLYTQPLSLI